MRYLKIGVVAPLAVLATLGLLFLMYSLINQQFEDPQTDPPSPIGSIQMPEVPDQIPEHPKPDRPEPQEEPPTVEPVEPTTTEDPEPPVITFDPPEEPVGPKGPGIWESGMLTPKDFVAPNYPPTAITRGIEGFVTVSFTVTPAGTVKDAEVVEAVTKDGTPTTVFNSEALRAAQRFRFSPQKDGDQPVEVVGVTYRFVFEMQGS